MLPIMYLDVQGHGAGTCCIGLEVALIKVGWQICGSCYTLVEAFDEQCPRCREPLHPTDESRLRRFAQNGIDPTNKGIPLKDAQAAAIAALGKLEEWGHFIEWVISLDDSGNQDTDSEALGRIFEVARTTYEGKGA
jgi:hypothetical protein